MTGLHNRLQKVQYFVQRNQTFENPKHLNQITAHAAA